MHELPRKIKKLVNRYKPIETEGLTLYPIKVENYEEYIISQRALGFAAQSLPVDYMSIPLLSAFYKMDYLDAVNSGRQSGLFASAILGLVLALRLNQDGEEVGEMLKIASFVVDRNDESKLLHIRFVPHGEKKEEIVITPIQYSRLRPIIAAQNGIEIPDELDNPELLQAERDLADIKAPNLNFKVENLIQSAAALTGTDEEEIYNWSVLKLSRCLSSYKRIIDYMVCGIGESQGTKWKGGNPQPHPWFDRAKEGSSALIPVGQFMGGAGLSAIENSGQEI